MSSLLLVLCTCPDPPTAQQLAMALVEQHLAACVNVQAPVTSIYRWQGQVEQANECLLLIKTHVDCYADLEAAILALHPYAVPEIIALPIERGATAYLNWITQCTHAIS